ncbi:MAG: methyltransferase family protein [Tepidisphaeraceae bacterium]
MSDEQPFRVAITAGFVIFLPLIAYRRIISQMTGERLNRLEEGWFILLTLRPAGLAGAVGLIAYMIDPASMAWSSVPLPAWLRWCGVGLGAIAGSLLVWTLSHLGKNLTDTVVTRKAHTLVTSGPYRWVRHPFYDCVALAILANSLTAANWFIFVTGATVFTLMMIRVRTEERNLAARFGKAYESYRSRTGRILPRIRGRQVTRLLEP